MINKFVKIKFLFLNYLCNSYNNNIYIIYTILYSTAQYYYILLLELYQ
jgi:hypothetical protein